MKIVLTGPESVGKSTLSQQLAYIYKGVNIKEFAREYVENLKQDYQYQDVVNITRQQIQEYDMHKHKNFCFFDTFLLISKVWFNQVYNRLPNWFEEEFAKRPVDLYLLCKDDIKWIADGVRENEDTRAFLFDIYKKELDSYGFAYKIIEGSGEQRLKNAVEAIDEIIKK